MQANQPYNPFKYFTGIFIPEVLVQSVKLTLGAKIVFGRLARYAGASGECFPKMATLAKAVGISLRQAHRYIAELEELGLISSIRRGSTSNTYQFLWQPILEGDVAEEHVISDMPDVADHDVPYMADYRSSILIRRESLEESHLNNIREDVTPRLLTEEDWPQTTALVQGRFLSVDAAFLWRFIHAAIQAVVSSGGNAEELTDKNLAWMVEEVFKNPKIYSAGLLLRAVPTMIENLIQRHAKEVR